MSQDMQQITHVKEAAQLASRAMDFEQTQMNAITAKEEVVTHHWLVDKVTDAMKHPHNSDDAMIMAKSEFCFFFVDLRTAQPALLAVIAFICVCSTGTVQSFLIEHGTLSQG
jgi:hypothetical protein